MPYQFNMPAFLQNESADEIHERMLASMPDDIDKSEGHFVWDNTRPAALEKARFVEFQLSQSIQAAFPHWAWDEWLDLHADQEGITRHPRNRSFGQLTVLGNPGTLVERGFQFATVSNLTPSILFESTEEVTIGNGSYTIMDTALPPMAVVQITLNQPSVNPIRVFINPDVGEISFSDDTGVLEQFSFDISPGADQVASLMNATQTSGYFTFLLLSDSLYSLASVNGTIIGTTIPVQALEGGTDGNVPPDAIKLQVRPDSNITYVSNQLATSGGTPEESDDALRERILSSIRRGLSFTGNDSDYVRWALEVIGVGQAVVEAEWNGPGTVRLFVVDANGIPANQQILDAVYEHIVSPDNRMARLAPIGAIVTVAAPVPIFVDVEAQITLSVGENLSTVTSRFEENLSGYWQMAASENNIFDVSTGMAQNWIRYVFVGATLAKTAGVENYDHTTLLVNGAMEDILIPVGAYPVTQGVNLYE